MQRLTTLYIDKESHNFSAAHYTIFSADSRERLHGHNYSVSARIVSPVGDNGLSADYNIYKTRLMALCDALDEYTLLAGDSPFQQIAEEGSYYRVKFSDDEMLFLKSDTQILPIRNATIEEFSHLILQRLLEQCVGEDLREIEICVASGAGQRACALWQC